MFSQYCTPAEERKMDVWRRNVADLATPVVIRSDNRAFRDGIPAPIAVNDDDEGRPLQNTKSRSSYDHDPIRNSRRVPRDARRSSSDYSHSQRRNSLRPSSGTGYNGYARQPEYDSHRHRSSSTRGASIWSALFSSSRKHRDRSVTHDRPLRRIPSPEYVYTKNEPSVTVYQARPKSQYTSSRAPRRDYVVERSGTTKSTRSRRDSLGIDDRMRLLDIQDRFKEEVERARQWQPPPAKRSRSRNYDRRSAYY